MNILKAAICFILEHDFQKIGICRFKEKAFETHICNRCGALKAVKTPITENEKEKK